MGCRPLGAILFIFNMLFWLAGVAILILGILVQIFYSSYVTVNDDLEQFTYGIYAIIAAGAFLTVVGSFGCMGACRGSPCMLGTYFVLLLVVVILEVAGGIYVYANKDEMNHNLQKSLLATIKNDYSIPMMYGNDQVQNPKTVAIDTMQRELSCCGALGPRDWADSLYNGPRSPLEIGVSGKAGMYKVPRSCCVDREDSAACAAGSSVQGIGGMFNAIHSDGCAKKIWNLITGNENLVLGVAIAIVAVELLAMIFAIMLCCSERRRDRYKA